MRTFDRRIPTDFTHVEKYPFSAIQKELVTKVERALRLPYWHNTWDQGAEGACVGFGTSMMLSILNETQARHALKEPYNHKYVPTWLWDQAKIIDEWPDTNPGDDNGTSVRAACDVLRTKGHCLVHHPVSLAEGIRANRWATTVDQMRTSISLEIPISIGINWYENFDTPTVKYVPGRETWIGEGDLGAVRGGHCVCVMGASDKRQAFKIKNSWGTDYPLVYLPYTTMQRLLDEQGEATLVTDR